ncbi:MAG: type II toxin-antitoxin system Phd/YefM family antitoxin [Candidatus Scalindua sp.]|nr:type II toxin-antitoxin system Phd/YefM family antitoxin [Candidatus Scalindua sp.]MBT5305157.1 type II toxin-antitoxin system Phd/YefM family antitoxin [Candidatus Scalindua sp.]MBT6051568.1 type II toxin-antitoxin system Phd/YefM family antitoxin [Candidatus Scalindua sp.]MBT6230995.1 type II toxin-antitoxin system Phd/YefM family antitoxin [Candidatus Scalindua sp.]MBT6561266.1 type II toxin-antitoxin system Phd/YefM family antitoxin [Candidatus Scalindua sp.]
MMTLHPQIIEKDGKKEFVVLPYEEFIVIKYELENYEDLKDLRDAKESSKHEESIPLSEVIKDLDLK